MADLNTTQDIKPWDTNGMAAQQKAARDAQRQELTAQREQANQALEAAQNDYVTKYGGSYKGLVNSGEVFNNNLQGYLGQYKTNIANIDRQLDTITKADQGLMPDGSPMRPEYQSLLDPKTGLMLEPYQIKVGDLNAKTIDPSQMEGLQAFKKEALRTGPSVWAQMMQQTLGNKKSGDLDKAALQSAAAGAQARGTLAMRGGLSSGSRERIARSNANDLLGIRQNIGRDYNTQNLQLLSDDEKSRLGMLGQLPGMESNLEQFNVNTLNDASKFNLGNKAKMDEYNIQNALEQKNLADTQNLDVYKEQQKKWAANRQADATANSGGGGGGGCCFIFLEARYGDGTMDGVVRRFRDEKLTPRLQRGYYKLSEVLVPLMRKSRAIKLMVRLFMTDPMVSYGKFYYGENRHGFIFKPVKNFWLRTFDYLGLDHKFVRENGETI